MLLPEQAGMFTRGSGAIRDDFWSAPRPQDPQGKALSVLLNERKYAR